MAHPDIDAYLTRQFEIFANIAANAQGEPKRRQVHNLRVSARRLQASLWLAQQSNEDLALGKARQSLRRLLRQLSKRRELDVAITDAKAYQIDVDDLRSRRRKATINVKKYLSKKRRAKLQRRVAKAVKKVQAAPSLDLIQPIAKLRRDLKMWLASPPVQDEQYHEMRLDLKKVRYALEALGRPATSLKPLQEQLGRLQDLYVLRGYVGEHPSIAKDEAAARSAADKLVAGALSEALTHLSVMSGNTGMTVTPGWRAKAETMDPVPLAAPDTVLHS